MSGKRATDQHVWTVTVAPGIQLDSVASGLERAGLAVDQVLEAIGIIVVRGTDALALQARQIAGVTDVTREVEFDIGPPDSKVS